MNKWPYEYQNEDEFVRIYQETEDNYSYMNDIFDPLTKQTNKKI